MSDEKRDNPGGVAPPPAIYFAGLVAGLIFNYFFPAAIAFLPRMVEIIVGIVFVAIAGFIIVFAFRSFSAAKTNIEPWKPTTAIVSSGVYRFSRNPIYLAMTLLYIGAALLLDSLWVLLFAVPILFLINFGVIAREEKYLTAKFGKEYLDYKKRVRRWL
jgi:protein-S-isoprenylcysteine O-methyltransferase Ste14